MMRYRISKGLKMSHHEVKQEHRQSEGDPHMKGAIRSRQAAMARSRMMAEVPDADVVLVNPVHVAVALRYEPAKGAPRVVAKGAGEVAARIREKASEHRVPMVENVPLARALYRACDLGQEIPAELYTAVAQVLAFVLSLRARGSSAGLHRPSHLVDERLNSFNVGPKGRRPGKARPAPRKRMSAHNRP
jgi:flagellar biosynthetic protein FlhB